MKPKEISMNIVNDEVLASGTDKELNVREQFVKDLKEYNFNLLNISDVGNVLSAISQLNKKYNTAFNVRDFDYKDYIDFEKVSKMVLTKDEFMDLIKRLRQHIENEGLSFRDLVIIEMGWLKTYSTEISSLLEKDVNIIKLPDKNVVFYKVDNRECYDRYDDFYEDFKRYEEELEKGKYTFYKVVAGRLTLTKTNYDLTSPYFIKKAVIGSAFSNKATRRIDYIIVKLIKFFLETTEYKCRANISEFIIQDFINSSLLYDYYVNTEEARKNNSELYSLHKKKLVKYVHEDFYETFANYLYEVASKE